MPISEKAKPNPYLDVPDREITTKDGRRLTKINPAYMTRQIGEIAAKRNKVWFHITSSNPIRPANTPDSLEAKALGLFVTGVPEQFEFISSPKAIWALGLIGLGIGMHRLRAREKEKENFILELTEAISEVKKLSGMLPICASCKKIRDDKGYWNQIESYIGDHSEAEFTHGICPDCSKKLYPEIYKEGPSNS